MGDVIGDLNAHRYPVRVDSATGPVNLATDAALLTALLRCEADRLGMPVGMLARLLLFTALDGIVHQKVRVARRRVACDGGQIQADPATT